MSLLDVTYVKQDDGEHCSNGRITDETSCRMAAAYIGETYARTWHGSTDTPGCIFANDGRNVVYFNTALDANGYNARYAEICLISRGFTFRLRGRSGSEQVTIRVDGTAPQTMTLSTQWTEFHSPTRSFTVSFNNDGSNRDVYFAADFEAQIRTDAFWQEWNCESGNGNWRCDRVRNGEFLWTSDYTITLGNRRKL
jgi:hypothetical protein